MIFRKFNNREINLKIDNEIKKLIEAKIETILILKIFILSFDNLILMFKKIVEVVRAAHQSTSIKKKNLYLKEQFDNVCQQNKSY